jgi:tetratricopeptide (TPR) repeat protein
MTSKNEVGEPLANAFDALWAERFDGKKILLGWGIQALRAGDLIEARNCFNSILYIDTHDVEAKKKVNEIDSIINSLGTPRTLHEGKKALVEYHLQASEDLVKQQDFDTAVRHLEEALAICPELAILHFKLGKICSLIDRHDEAIRLLRETLEITPDFPGAHLWLGLNYNVKGLLDEAITELEKAVTLEPDIAQGHFMLGWNYEARGRFDDAISRFKMALAVKPDYGEAHFRLGLCYDRQGKVTEAIGHFRETTKILPDFAEAYLNLGIVLNRCGMVTEAIIQLKK